MSEREASTQMQAHRPSATKRVRSAPARSVLARRPRLARSAQWATMRARLSAWLSACQSAQKRPERPADSPSRSLPRGQPTLAASRDDQRALHSLAILRRPLLRAAFPSPSRRPLRAIARRQQVRCRGAQGSSSQVPSTGQHWLRLRAAFPARPGKARPRGIPWLQSRLPSAAPARSGAVRWAQQIRQERARLAGCLAGSTARAQPTKPA